MFVVAESERFRTHTNPVTYPIETVFLLKERVAVLLSCLTEQLLADDVPGGILHRRYRKANQQFNFDVLQFLCTTTS